MCAVTTRSAVATPATHATAGAPGTPTHDRKRVGIVVGSLRKNSFSLAIANAILELFNQASQASQGSQDDNADIDAELVYLDDLPLYNQDFDDPGPLPKSYTAFRERMRSLDAFVFVTPEYNRSMPAVLKNALDVGSRPAGQSIWATKPCGIISSSPGPVGGFGANQHLKQTLGFLDFRIMQQPEMYLGKITESVDEDGAITERTKSFLHKFTTSFAVWIRSFRL
ncbi:MAG: NAD(P)H-dependent oxidoreductase [Coriobacteriales bacterium]|jgi:chromate reductase|nr:NAD(P)H-dependent oxidoreductase [Coriobacteriales bacterium]